MREALDLKYRPKKFSEVIGQDATCTMLKNMFVRDKVSSEILISGPHGTGKTTLARILARTFICQHRSAEGEACGECEQCISILDGKSYAVTEINGANVTKVEDYRQLQEQLLHKPIDSDYRVIIIDECHMISKASQNMLLKPLEDGITNVYWIFCTTDPQKMLETIRSRCLCVTVKFPTKEAIVGRLKEVCEAEKIPNDESMLPFLAEAGKYHMRDILKLLQKMMFVGGVSKENLAQFLNLEQQEIPFKLLGLLTQDIKEALIFVESVSDKISPQDLFKLLGEAAIDVFKVKIGLAHSLFVNIDVVKEAGVKLGEYSGKVAEFVNLRSKYIDRQILTCELVNLYDRFKTGFESQIVVSQDLLSQKEGINNKSDKAVVLKDAATSNFSKLDELATRSVTTQIKPKESAHGSFEISIDPDELSPISFEGFKSLLNSGNNT